MIFRITMSALAALALGGCGMSSLTSGIGGGVFGSSAKSDSKGVTTESLMSAAKSDAAGLAAVGADVAHGCPRITVGAREGHVTIYEPGRAGDGLAVMHRGEIMRTARECAVARGQVTVKYGFSGRVLLGPRGRPGSVALPVTVLVTDAKRERVAADKARIDVAITSEKPEGYFSIVRTVTFNVPEGTRPGEFEVFIGFDQNVPGAG
jgi:hypothetical protein